MQLIFCVSTIRCYKFSMNKETIFALSTIFGKSGVAVIRVSGPDAYQTITHLQVQQEILPRNATLVTLHDDDKLPIDRALLLWFPAPYSFTGENIVELHVHGSKAVINLLLRELAKIFRVAAPGEFSRRAFLNEKLDLTQAEGLSDLIDAETKMQARQAFRQMSGELENLYHKWRHDLIEVIAGIEAYIDFPDEGIPESIISQVQQKIDCIIQEMMGHLQDNRGGEKLREGFRISIIGAPNTGKSTLFNYLTNQDIAIVSDISGTTRDVLVSHIDLDGYPIAIYDTAGVRDTLDPIEIEGIIRAKKCAKNSDLKIALFAIEDLPNMDPNTKSLLDSQTVCLASKADHLSADVEVFVQDRKFLPISIRNNIGLDKLMAIIKKHLFDQLAPSELPVITRERHRQAITVAVENLQRYNVTNDLVLATEDLRVAARELGEITGHIKIDDILDQLFSKFCIGK